MRTYAQRRRYIGSQLKIIVGLLLILFLLLAALLIFLDRQSKAERKARINALIPDNNIELTINPDDLVLPTAGKLDDSINRPLFMTDRKPYQPPLEIDETGDEPQVVAQPLVETFGQCHHD